MNCDAYQLQIDDYVDDALEAPARVSLEAHLAGCASCRELVDDLRQLKAAAAALEPHVPPPHAWTRIASAVEADRQRRWPVPGLGERWDVARLPFPRLAAAAVAATLILGVGWMAWRDLTPTVRPAGGDAALIATDANPDPDIVVSADEGLQIAEDEFVRTIAGLEGDFTTGQTQLDADTADVVQASLTVVNQAIGESRAALQTQPANEVAQESLFEAFHRKVELLQDALALINEMRQGNQAGAARIVSGQNP